jgi:F-type H+-transporting ATPase subunit delta
MEEERAREVVRCVAAARSRDRLAVLTQFRRYALRDATHHAARVESAAPLNPEVQRLVQARLEWSYKRPLSTSFEENGALIGGMRIRVGDDVIDGSVRAALDAIQANI